MDEIWPKISCKMSIDELQSIHRRIWQHVMDHGRKPDTPYRYGCVICGYASDVRYRLTNKRTKSCRFCPIKGMAHNRNGRCCNGLIQKWWQLNDNPKFRRQIAKQIRDIEFVSDEEMRRYIHEHVR